MTRAERVQEIIEEVMGERLNPGLGTGAYGVTRQPTIRAGGDSASFRIDGRSFNMGKLRMLSARLGTEDIEVEICIDAHYVSNGEPSDPGADDHVLYTIKGIP